MERIQHRALKFVYNDFNSSYDKHLTCAELPTLELSRKKAILVEVYKAANKLSLFYMGFIPCERFEIQPEKL